MKSIEVSITGVTPLLQHRFSEGSEVDAATRTIVQNRGTPREQAESVCYRNGTDFYIPGTWISGAIIEAGGSHKLRGSRKSAKYIVPAAVRVKEIEIPICNGDGKTLASDFEVDSRPVTIPATKGKIMRHRPRFDHWSATFGLTINDKLLPEEFVQQLLTEAGEQQGIGDFRPNKRGPFGCFRIVRWELQQ
jgi:hypothetical protein